MNIVSLFSGAGGLDIGFNRANFKTVWANEYDKNIIPTYKYNFSDTELCTKSITDINYKEIPDCDGIIGGPPCQSWSVAGSRKGINDSRGKLFFKFIEIIDTKKPTFFLAENVPGILSKKNINAFNKIKSLFRNIGYEIYIRNLNAINYEVPQLRSRVFIIGLRSNLKKDYYFPAPFENKLDLHNAIWDLRNKARPANKNGHVVHDKAKIKNNHFIDDVQKLSSIYMSRNRVKKWNQPSFTIQASGRQCPIHPQAPIMLKTKKDKMIFKSGMEHLYRKLSVRECARIQTFPDEHVFKYNQINHGYQMVGNAVPCKLAEALALSIKQVFDGGDYLPVIDEGFQLELDV